MARFEYYNANPYKLQVGDCVIRAVSKVLGQTWNETYIGLCVEGLLLGDMPSSNSVWGHYLHSKGFHRRIMPDECPACYTVRDFCDEHPKGKYLLALDGHVVAAIDGAYHDTWDSGDKPILYFWERGN